MLHRITSISKRTLLPLLLILFLSALAPTAAAQLQSLHWTEWHLDVVLQHDGSLAVTETQTMEFSGAPFHFGARRIPVRRAGNNAGRRAVTIR